MTPDEKTSVEAIWAFVVLHELNNNHGTDGEYLRHSGSECGCARFLGRLRKALNKMMEDETP